ncbi:MAG: ABC transporter permease [Bacteroidia bacterium]
MKRRLLFFFPSLLFIALIGFVIAVNAPGDPVQTLLHDVTGNNSFSSSSAIREQENILRHRLGLDLPVFYFSIHSLAEPDTLYKVYPINEREMLLRLVRNHGNWQVVSEYYLSLKDFVSFLQAQNAYPNYLKQDVNENISQLLNLRNENDENLIANRLNLLSQYVSIQSELQNTIDSSLRKTSVRSLRGTIDSSLRGTKQSVISTTNLVVKNWNTLRDSKPTWKNYFPAISFHSQNQFQRWLFGDGEFSKGIIRGDFGISYTTQQPVTSALKSKIKWSLLLSIVSLIISLLIAIPLGKYSILHPKSFVNKFISGFKNFAFATPVFWLGTFLLILFANPTLIKIFPASGVQPANGFGDAGFLQRILISSWFLILPIVCYSYASIALLAATVQSSLKETMKEEYIKTVFAKGLSLKQVVSRHAMRNVLLPLITLVANFFPAALGGSVIIENIFSIPGMGNEITNAVYTQNYPVIVAIVTITGFFTLTGYLLADIVYRIADPRIRFADEN